MQLTYLGYDGALVEAAVDVRLSLNHCIHSACSGGIMGVLQHNAVLINTEVLRLQWHTEYVSPLYIPAASLAWL